MKTSILEQFTEKLSTVFIWYFVLIWLVVGVLYTLLLLVIKL